MTAFFGEALNTVATFYRIYRSDGVVLGFCSHDKALWFGGIRHRAAPGMVPSAIRLNASLQADSAEVEGVLSHDSIRAADLSAGLFDEAKVEIGAVDWQSLENYTVYSGSLGRIEQNEATFIAELRSAKALLDQDLVPRTSPSCRALFCGPGCSLSAARFSKLVTLLEIDSDANSVVFDTLQPDDYFDGTARFLDGPQTGLNFGIAGIVDERLLLDRPLDARIEIGTKALIVEGCDHTLAMCSNRFSNAINFRGEAHLPGNDLLARYGSSD